MKGLIIALLIVLLSLQIYTTCSSVDRYHSIGGGSPGMFISYAIRGGSCGCGLRPDGRPYCDMTGPISYDS